MNPHTYWKCLVIEIDIFCESKVVLDKNFTHKEFESKMNEFSVLYPDDSTHIIVVKELELPVIA